MHSTMVEDALPSNPLWYKDAVIYELHVRAFFDSGDDGIGDFVGLTSKLDYLQDLGVTCLWILPFYPSPLRDDGYDVADYEKVHPTYGTMRDFRLFLREAHDRGLRVVTELVINHTSDQHPWFQAARRAPAGSAKRDYYVWSSTNRKYSDARIIFTDSEPSNWHWDDVAQAYYWHRFFRHQPDLNFENAHVRRAVMKVLHYWLRMGVDGLRLDAIPYLFEREGTNCENLPETHVFLKEIRAEVDKHYNDRLLLAEANQWPADAGPDRRTRRAAPTFKAASATLGAKVKRDLLARIGSVGGKLTTSALRIGAETVAEVLHERLVPLDRLDKRLKGVMARAQEAVLVGDSGGRAAILGVMPEAATTADEVETFVRSLLKKGAIAFDAGPPKKAAAKGAVALSTAKPQINPITHRIKTVGANKVLERIRFACGCRGPLLGG